LSFSETERNDDLLDFSKEMKGDMYLCYQQILKIAKCKKKKIREELLLVFTHGCLHLLGLHHDNLEHERRLFAIQKQLFLKIKEKLC
jgi:probable rRNA maturation factor